jgi:hypothetical protein
MASSPTLDQEWRNKTWKNKLIPLPVHGAGHHVRHGLRGVVDHRHPVNKKPGLHL